MTVDDHRVVSFDPIYQFSGEQIQQRFEATFDGILDQVRASVRALREAGGTAAKR